MSLVRGECVSPVSFALPARDGQAAVAAPTLSFQELAAGLSFPKGNGKLAAVFSPGFQQKHWWWVLVLKSKPVARCFVHHLHLLPSKQRNF